MRVLSSGNRLINVGTDPAGLRMSEKLRSDIRSNMANKLNLEANLAYLSVADSHIQKVYEVLDRMTELTAQVMDTTKTPGDIAAFEAEFQAYKDELSRASREGSFYGRQVASREALVSYDANSETMRYWGTNDIGGALEIERKFGASGTDAFGTAINFDPNENFGMSRDGRSLFYLDSNQHLCSYDMLNNKVTRGTDTYNSGDTMVVDETGALYVNGNGTLYTIDTGSLTRTSTTLTTLAAGKEFTVYNNSAIYWDAATTNMVTTDLSILSTTTLVDSSIGSNLANLNSVFGSSTHAISGSGRYIVGKLSATSIGLVDCKTGAYSTASLGASCNLSELQISEDGDLVYYVDTQNSSVNTIAIQSGTMATGQTVMQGVNANSFLGLDVGGAGFQSLQQFYLGGDSKSTIYYESPILNLYSLGLANTSIDNPTNAGLTLQDLQRATNRVASQHTELGAIMSRLERILNATETVTANMQDKEGLIRNADVAKEATEYSQQEILNQYTTSLLAQYNASASSVLKLLSY
ncbi:MAG: flagellin [Chlamydiales bacterium]|nr:flagellin [Chlamydiales bacterium]